MFRRRPTPFSIQRSPRVAFACALLAIALGATGCGESPSSDTNIAVTATALPLRIVCIAPSLTETTFALGLGDRVVGVSDYCDYPPEALERPKIGGLFDTNLEAIVGLSPDLVLLLVENDELERSLRSLGVETLAVNHQTIPGVLESLTTIGRRCGAEQEAARLRTDIEQRLENLRRRCAEETPMRTLVVVDRPLDAGRIEGLYAAGDSPFFEYAFEVVGAENVIDASAGAFPLVSVESVIETNPEVILDLSVGVDSQGPAGRESAVDDWQELAEHVQAVREQRVYMINDDFATSPGPRFIQLLEKMARILHPDRFADDAP